MSLHKNINVNVNILNTGIDTYLNLTTRMCHVATNNKIY